MLFFCTTVAIMKRLCSTLFFIMKQRYTFFLICVSFDSTIVVFYMQELMKIWFLHHTMQQTSDSLDNPAEDDAVEKLIVRLNLILMEEDWKRPSGSFLRNNSEPW